MKFLIVQLKKYLQPGFEELNILKELKRLTITPIINLFLITWKSNILNYIKKSEGSNQNKNNEPY